MSGTRGARGLPFAIGHALFRPMLAYEARRLWRGVPPWLFVAAVPALFALIGDWQAPGLERCHEMLPYLSLLNTALTAYVAWVIQRDRRAGADEITLAWPVSSLRLYLARTLALGTLTAVLWAEAVVLALGYTAVSYGTAARAAGTGIPVAHALREGGLILLSLTATFLAAQATGQLAAAILPGVPGLVALVLYRAFTLGGPRLILGILQWPYALLASPEFLWDGWPWLARYLHLGIFADVYVAHQAFWVVGSVAALVALACLFRPRRDRATGVSAVLLMGAVVVPIAAAAPFVAAESRYARSHASSVSTYGEPVKPGLHSGPRQEALSDTTAPAPVRYDLAVDLTQPPEATIAATVVLAGPPDPGDGLELTLRRTFHVDEVRIEGVVVPFEREGDLLRLPAPSALSGGSLAISLRYHGAVADWRLDPHEQPAALVASEFVYLPSTWGWYPVPGKHRLTWEIGMTSMVARALADRTVLFNDAEPTFVVSVRAPEGVRFLAGFVQEAGGTWYLEGTRNQLTLLGGNWVARGDGAARFAVPFEELDTWRASTAEVERLFRALADWTGVTPLTVVPSPVSFVNAADVSLLLDSQIGDLFEAPPDAGELARFARRWLFGLLSVQPRFLAPTAPELEGVPSATVQEFDALRAYVLDRALHDVFGADAPPDPPGLASPEDARVEAWTAGTSLEEQQAALRRLFHDALLRPLTPADLAFLDEGGAE